VRALAAVSVVYRKVERMSDTADSNASKPTDQWATGDEPMTGPQRSYLETLAQDTGEEIPNDLTKAQASELIDRLQNKSPRLDS
jgi:Protein of unknown function (DUF3072)